MFDHARLSEILVDYKQAFERSQWPEERYKWEAVRHFQDVWDAGADDFGDMLEQSLSKCGNLLVSSGNFPARMIVELARERPEEVRSMFVDLFDETRDYYERIATFKGRATDVLRAVRGQDTTLHHYQDENTVTTYLWLRFPDRYYVYKYSEVKAVAKELGSGYEIKKGRYASNLRNHLALYDEIREALKQDAELVSLLRSNLTSECYPDPELRTLTADVCFYISRHANECPEQPETDAPNVTAPCVTPSAEDADDATAHGFWWLNANPRIWSFSNISVGEVQPYTLLNESGGKRRIYQNFLDARTGDMVIGYESYPVKQVVAIGRIAAEQDGQSLDFEKLETLATPIDYRTLHDCPELANMQYFTNPRGTLFKLTPDEYDFIVDLIREENPVSREGQHDPYDKGDFLDDVYMDEARYERLRAVLLRKKNVILQGAPGVGKTFCARRLAWSIMGERDDDRIEFVQFHQSYSYEDFVGGWRPEEEGFAWRPGVFYRFCKRAENQPDKPFFFIIDEINRGNLSRIFGELLMLVEADYRDVAKVTLPYGDAPFSVPGNVYIIGMMNTADRSLAMIDYALRRRFSFFDMAPAFDTEGFTRYRESLASDTVDELVAKVEELNAEIARDGSLGKGFRIGHSYFCGHDASEDADEWCLEVVDFEILPMLSEYWFDDDSKVARWDNVLHAVFQG